MFFPQVILAYVHMKKCKEERRRERDAARQRNIKCDLIQGPVMKGSIDFIEEFNHKQAKLLSAM